LGDPAPSISDYLTDGALAAMCAELGLLIGQRVELRDPEGRPIVADAPGKWRILDPVEPDNSELLFPLLVRGAPIGSLAVSMPVRTHLRRTLSMLAQTVGELCEQEIELRHQTSELATLYRLSSLLVMATDLDEVLTVALDSALDVLDLDAGSIFLFKDDDDAYAEDERNLILKASRSLSESWVDNPAPLSAGRIFDRQALAGKVVAIDNLQQNRLVLNPARAAGEGLVSFLSAGIVFNDRPLGVIRLYGRNPRPFSDADQRLIQSIAQQSALAIEQTRSLALAREERRIQRQLKLAADVQQRMLPRRFPRSDRFDLAASYTPCFELAGDFYDFTEIGGRLGIVVGDVAGKGVPAALLMSAVRASLHAHVQDPDRLHDAMARVNAAVCRDTRTEEFATIWYGLIDPASLTLASCSAGHDPPMLADTAGTITDLKPGGMVVGVDPEQRYELVNTQLHTGDTLIVFTDGLCDAMNFSSERFGRNRLRQAVTEILKTEPDAGAGRILEHIHWELRQFAGLAERPDDQTIVVVRVR
jgi:sigma-B regulation protein RsbU (phosphoserine phosphatase)